MTDRMENDSDGAIVLFSGGQDSTTCLAWALDRYRRVETVGFFYGQRHVVEMDVRPTLRNKLAALDPQWGARLGQDHIVDLTSSFAALGSTAMTSNAEIKRRSDGLPTTFVPGRNLLFMIYAAAVADRRGFQNIVAGMCQTDYSGYPDCRDETIKAQQTAIALGFGHAIAFETPLMFIDKAATWQMANDLGGQTLIRLIVEETHTCYIGERTTKHAWGAGCGQCPACELRSRGWSQWSSGATKAG